MTEQWKQYHTFEVSNYGNVRRNNKEYQPSSNAGKYKLLCNRLLHRIVAELFIPNPDNLPYAIHKTTDLDDNSANNIEWSNKKRIKNGKTINKWIF